MKGELKDILCGQFLVKFDYTVTTDWDNIPSVIPESKFIGWNHPGIKENCFDYAVEQLRQVGHTPRWERYQLYLEQDVKGMKKGIQKDQFEKRVEYLKKILRAGIPVMVGVDDDSYVTNDDMTTEHFITIVGMGKDASGKYFLFYDNAVAEQDIGASNQNRLYCKSSQYLIEGNGDLRNTYIQINTKKKKYIISQIRETK